MLYLPLQQQEQQLPVDAEIDKDAKAGVTAPHETSQITYHGTGLLELAPSVI